MEPARALEALAAAASAAAPFVLLLEDLHEADVERRAFVSDLATAVRRTRGAALVVTSRSDPGEPFQRQRLEPLRSAETRALLAHTLGAELPEAAADWVAGASAGNPLFALEYLRYLVRLGHLWSDGRSWRWRRPAAAAAPPTIEALVEHFLTGALAEPALEGVVAALTLLPLESGGELLERAAGVSGAVYAAATRELERRGVLARGEFAHPLYREAAARLVPPPARREAARRALASPSLPTSAVPALVSAAELDTEAAIAVLSRTAETAAAFGDDALAARLLAQASDLAAGQERGALALQAAKLLMGRDYPRMVELAERAASLLPDPTEALFLQASGLSVRGDAQGMARVIERLPPAARSGPEWLRRQVRLLHQAGRREELIAAWEASPHRAEVDAGTVHFVGWAYLHAGRPRKAAELAAERLARPDTDEASAADLLELQASIAFYAGDNDAAERLFTALLERARATGAASPPNVANLLRNRAVVRMQQARPAESLPDLEAALSVYEEVGHGLHHAGTLVMMSYAYQELGAYERAEEVLTEALETARRSGAARFLGTVVAQLADLYLEWPGDAHGALALRYASQAMEAGAVDPGGLEGLTARYLISRAATALGRPAEGLALAQGLLDEAEPAELVEVKLAAHHAAGLALESLGRAGEALRHHGLARSMAAERGMTLHEHRYGLEVDRLTGDAARAATRRAWFAERGLQHGVNVARRYFPEPGADEPARPRATGGPARLEVLGPMRVSRAGEVSPVRGRRRRALLLALAEARLAGAPEVSRLDLIETLYPAADEARAVASLEQLVSEVRKDLGPNAVKTGANGYALGELSVDAEEFLTTSATGLWRGELGEGADWDVRESVRERLLAALTAVAHGLMGEDPVEAARAAGVLRRHDPYDASYLRLHLTALGAAGLEATLADEYGRARRAMAEVGEDLPASPAEFLGPSPG